jgi:ribosomal protein S18 acetylase RimI-like enzyme
VSRETISYKIKEANETDIHHHLMKCSDSFVPALDTRINIKEYATKIFDKAITFEAWDLKDLIGLIAVYLNNDTKIAFITNVSVVGEYKGFGIAGELLKMCINHTEFNSFKEIRLEVNKDNFPAINFYKKHKFTQTETKDDSIFMSHDLINK